MDAVVHEEKIKITRRQVVMLALWTAVLLLFAFQGAAWYWLALIGANLVFEVWNMVNRLRTSYVLTLDNLILKQGDTVIMEIPLKGIKVVLRGTFRELLKSSALKGIPNQKIQAVPALGGSKDVVVLVFEAGGNDSNENGANGRKAVFIQPSLALQLVLEQDLSRWPVTREE